MKAGRDLLRDEQKEFLDELKAAGGMAFVAYDFAGFGQSFELRGLHSLATTAATISTPSLTITYDEPTPYIPSRPLPRTDNNTSTSSWIASTLPVSAAPCSGTGHLPTTPPRRALYTRYRAQLRSPDFSTGSH